MSQTECIVSAQHNRPVVGLTQDSMTAIFLMTKPNVLVSRQQFQQIAFTAGVDEQIPSLLERLEKYRTQAFYDRRQALLNERVSALLEAKDPDAQRYLSRYESRLIPDGGSRAEQFTELLRPEVEEAMYVTGRELFSLLLPEDYFYSKKNEADPGEPVVIIKEGVLLKGTVDKKIVGATHNSIVHDLYKMHSPARAEEFLSKGKFLADKWLAAEGLSVTLADCKPAVEGPFKDQVQKQLHEARVIAWSAGPRSANPLEEMKRQQLVREALCNVKNSVGKLAMESITPDNNIAAMITSGSKGSLGNFASILGPVGQQEKEGNFIQPAAGGRSLPCYERYSRDPTAGGFVSSSYLQGMTPQEMFFHQMAARESLSTNAKTAETGYMQRRIIKILEDAVVYPDGTVRNAAGVLIQYNYGEDNFTGEKLTLAQGQSTFINIDALVNTIKERRKAGLAPQYQPYRPTTQPKYIMPSFEEPPIVEQPEEEREEDEDESEEEPDADDASDLSDIEEAVEEDY